MARMRMTILMILTVNKNWWKLIDASNDVQCEI
jgi:hypothetical protein